MTPSATVFTRVQTALGHDLNGHGYAGDRVVHERRLEQGVEVLGRELGEGLRDKNARICLSAHRRPVEDLPTPRKASIGQYFASLQPRRSRAAKTVLPAPIRCPGKLR